MTNSEKLAITLKVINLLSSKITLVAAGGAARDDILGGTIKDIDLFVLDGLAESERCEEESENTAMYVRELLGVKHTDVLYSYREESGNLAYVIKFEYEGVQFDLIEFMEYQPSARKQVEYFDTTLNMVWFVYDESEEGLVPVPHPRFVETLLSGHVQVLPYIDGDVNNRLRYLQNKYPGFEYPFDTTQKELPLD